jgi:hypothetical protein
MYNNVGDILLIPPEFFSLVTRQIELQVSLGGRKFEEGGIQFARRRPNLNSVMCETAEHFARCIHNMQQVC